MSAKGSTATDAAPGALRRDCLLARAFGRVVLSLGATDRVRTGSRKLRERRLQCTRAGKPLSRLGIGRALDDAKERRRELSPHILQRRSLASRVSRHQVVERDGLDRKVVGHEVVEQHAKAVDVAPDRRLVTRQHFRRHVKGRADDLPSAGTQFSPLLTRAEIHQDETAAFLAHHVLRFDVAMHQTGNVHGRQSAAQLVPNQRRFAATERPMADEHLLERQAAHELHPQSNPAFVCSGAVHGHDVRVAHASQGLSFVQQPCGQLRVGRGAAPQQLDRDRAIELWVVGPIDRAERSLPDFLEQHQSAPMAQIVGRTELLRLTARPVLPDRPLTRTPPGPDASRRSSLSIEAARADPVARCPTRHPGHASSRFRSHPRSPPQRRVAHLSQRP